MPHLTDLPEVLPLFPLSGAILLPRAKLPLNVFEPRYLAMVDECLKTPERLIGIIQPRVLGAEGLQAVGCAGRLVAFAETGDGRYLITLEGISRFQLGDEIEGFTPYRRAKALWEGFRADRQPIGALEDFDRGQFLGLLQRFLRHRELTADLSSLDQGQDEMLINALAMLCPFGPEERQALLEAATLSDRRKVLESLFEFSLYQGETPEDLLQ